MNPVTQPSPTDTVTQGQHTWPTLFSSNLVRFPVLLLALCISATQAAEPIARDSDLPRLEPPDGSTRDMVLWYRQPAEKWLEAMPLGNGLIGAMIFGGIQSEVSLLTSPPSGPGAPTTITIPTHLITLYKSVIWSLPGSSRKPRNWSTHTSTADRPLNKRINLWAICCSPLRVSRRRKTIAVSWHGERRGSRRQFASTQPAQQRLQPI